MASQTEYFVHPTAVVDAGAVIGRGTRIWHFSHIMPKARIGESCNLGQNVFVGNDVVIGNRCKVQNNVSIYEGVVLSDEVFCGPSMVFTNVLVPRCEFPQDRTEFYLKTRVERGASFGANSTIVCGTTIGECAFIAAGAVVTHDVPAFAMMVGVPARQIGWVGRRGDKLTFDADSIAVDQDGRRYRLTNGKVEQISA